MTRRPFRLRVLMDVELTEAEWTTLAQAQSPDAASERQLRLIVVDDTQGGSLSTVTAVTEGRVLMDVEAKPARLLMKPPDPIPTALLEGLKTGTVAVEELPSAGRLPDVLEDDNGPVA